VSLLTLCKLAWSKIFWGGFTQGAPKPRDDRRAGAIYSSAVRQLHLREPRAQLWHTLDSARLAAPSPPSKQRILAFKLGAAGVSCRPNPKLQPVSRAAPAAGLAAAISAQGGKISMRLRMWTIATAEHGSMGGGRRPDSATGTKWEGAGPHRYSPEIVRGGGLLHEPGKKCRAFSYLGDDAINGASAHTSINRRGQSLSG